MGIRKRLGGAWHELTKRSSYNAQGGALTQGGYQNLGTGAGGGLDKSEGGFFYPTRWYSRHIAEIVRVQSSAARKFVEMPIDDMFAGWRDWSGDDEGATEAMADVDERLMVAERVTDAIKAGRQQGTALLVMVTQESGGDLTEPLMPERIREGDLVELRIYDQAHGLGVEVPDGLAAGRFQPAGGVLCHAVPRRGLLRASVSG